MNPLEAYLSELSAIRSSGAAVKETSYYTPLANLLNEIGKSLKPRVRCILPIQNRGAGIPDGGFFTAEQFQRASDAEPLPGQLPSRGVLEAKSTGEDAWVVADGTQVSKYWGAYRQVLVTNYRDFVLVGQDADGKPAKLETYRLAASEKAFWAAAAHPRKTTEKHGDAFVEFLKRAMMHAAVLAAPADLAWFLASYAREAKARIETSEMPALATIRAAMEEALGLRFEGTRGDHFFRSTLVQTLFYGMFSAWVLWSKSHPPTDRSARFDWGVSTRYLRVPILRKLFSEVAEPGQLEHMDLLEVLDWAGATLNRVDRAAFRATFEETHAVQYFYEPFLQAFDPELRKELGVWYTPDEIVHYMVARVDEVLRNDLGLADGLADPNVYVLDPCCGTGAYLVAVLERIAETLRAKGGDALLGQDLKQAALKRVFGFELLPAPFVVSHLQLGLLLQRLGAPLSESKRERAGVYLTNALTGWEPPEKPKRLPFVELEEERDAADEVKRDKPILVILGNPPYNGYSGVAMGEERDLSTAYRTTKRAPAPQGQGLNDLYVRFFRMAERRIVEKTGRGVVCFISNYSWLDGLSFTGMRERYLEVFDRIWIDNLHGDRVISEYAPDGRTSETVFATGGSSPGIKIGTAISLLMRSGAAKKEARVSYRDFEQARAAERRAALLESMGQGEPGMALLKPILELGLPFKPRTVAAAYLSWPLLPELFPVSFPGVKTSRDDVVVDIDRERLVRRMEQYFDPSVSDEEMARIAPGAMDSTARFDAGAVRRYLVGRGLKPECFVRFCYRPFDVRWLYWEPETKLLDEKRSEYFPQVFEGNMFLFTTGRTRKSVIEPALATPLLNDLNLMDSGARGFPLHLGQAGQALFGEDAPRRRANLTEGAEAYLGSLGARERELFLHALATLHSPGFRDSNADPIRGNWPRIPLPARKELLLASALLGCDVAALLDPECSVKQVTASPIREELRVVGVISATEGRLNLDEEELEVTAGWGHRGKGGVTMPAKGKVIERGYSPEEIAAMAKGGAALGLSREQVFACLGETTHDVYLNERAYWKNVPARVWGYTLGGYQVIKKWLSYREKELLGRALKIEEARYVTEIARRIAALLLLSPALDANYEAVKGSCHAWKRAGR